MPIRFGPSGNSDSFYAQGYKGTVQAPAWLDALGLNAMEYSFGKGVSLSEKTGNAIADAAEQYGIAMSVHAPYYINLAVSDPERREKNYFYFKETLTAAHYLRAKRVVFHPGSSAKMERADAMALVLPHFKEILSALDDEGLLSIALCPETMGKRNQLGDLDETIEICRLDERIIPAIDFAHLHARSMGGLVEKADFAAILDALHGGVGAERAKIMHVHFSRIEYSQAGERRHRTFADEGYGPDFRPLAELIAERGLEPVIICESKGTMAEDAVSMRNTYLEVINHMAKDGGSEYEGQE